MLRIFLKLVVLILAVAAGRLAYNQGLDLPPFALRNVTITGNWEVSADSILKITGLEKGKSIYKQNLNYAALKLIHHPGVVSCSIKRGFFSTIAVDINMAEPALLVNNGNLNALSREGMILPMDSRMPVLPLVSGRSFAFARCYDHLRDPDIAYALETYDAIMAISPNLSTRLSEMNFGSDNVLRLYFSPAGTTVLLDKSDIENGIKRFAALINSGLVDPDSISPVLDLRYGPVMIESSGGA